MASLNEEVELLRKVPLFAQMDPAKLKLLAFTSERMTFQPGQELCHQGDPGDAAYVVMSGDATVLIETEAGEIPVAELGANAVIGEIAVLCEIPRTATVRANTELQALKIEKEHFLRMMSEFPGLAVEVMRVLAERLTATTAELSKARARLKELAG